MEYRKIIKFGNSSHVVSVPREWMRKNKLKKGDLLSIGENSNGELIFSPNNKTDTVQELKRIIISIDNKDDSTIKREIIAAYLNDYSIIVLEGNDLLQKNGKVREFVNNLLALEVVEQDRNKLITRDLLNLNNISIDELTRKIDITIRAMSSDVKSVLEKKYSDLEYRDQDVNRMMYLIIRLIRRALDNPSFAKSLGKTQRELLYIWHFVFHIEKVADEIKRIGICFDNLRENPSILRKLVVLYCEIEDLYLKTMKSYYSGDSELALKISSRKKEILESCDKFYEKNWNKKVVPVAVERLKNLVGLIHDSGRRIYA